MPDKIKQTLAELQKLENQIKIEERKIRKIEQKTSFRKLTTKEKYQLLTVLEKTISPTSPPEQNELYLKLNRIWKDVVEYRYLLRNLYLIKRDFKKLLKNFSFKDCIDNTCSHVFVEKDGHLLCICCGHSTIEYHLTEKETQLLICAAKEQKRLIEHIAQENIPFLMVLASINNTKQGVDFYNRNLSFALKQDQKNQPKNRKNYDDIKDPCLLSTQILAEKKAIEESCSSSFKELLLQECQVAEQEINILAGKNISKLFEDVKEEKERFAIAKAYYNLLKKYFRENSGHFENDQDAKKEIHLTANKEINQMILDRRIKRKN